MYLNEINSIKGDDYAAHKQLAEAFHEQRILFQRRGNKTLVLSEKPVNGGGRDVSRVLARVNPGDQFIFVARLNPVAARQIEGKTRRVSLETGRVKPWLESMFRKNGFAAEFTFTTEGTRRSVKGAVCISLNSVVVNGVLTVEDPGLFRNAVEKGIGHGRGLGFGFLNIFDFA